MVSYHRTVGKPEAPQSLVSFTLRFDTGRSQFLTFTRNSTSVYTEASTGVCELFDFRTVNDIWKSRGISNSLYFIRPIRSFWRLYSETRIKVHKTCITGTHI